MGERRHRYNKPVVVGGGANVQQCGLNNCLVINADPREK